MQGKDDKLVYHPSHYNTEGRKECWDEMIEIFGVDAVVIFDILSAYKYRYRAGLKEGNPSEQDKEKIKNYMNHTAQLMRVDESVLLNDLAENCFWTMDVILKKDRMLEKCNPEENPDCPKTNCYINGGECHHRTKEEKKDD